MAKGGKIKNWSRQKYTRGSNDVYRWEHDDKNAAVRIVRNERDNYVAYFQNQKSKNRKKIAEESNKKKVKKKAAKWMRKHPNL